MRILLIEDDVSLCRSVRLSLEQQGFKVTVCHDGEEGLFYILENAHDLVLLDRMLPGMSGTQVLQKARQQHCTVPVIFLTALGSLEERITGLDCGADDYIVKPFALEELMLSFGDLTFDSDQSLLSCGTKNCTLSRREGELLALFLKNARQTLPRSVILTRVWGMDAEVESGNLDNYIHFLRRRLKSVDSQVQLKTIRGIGYQLY